MKNGWAATGLSLLALAFTATAAGKDTLELRNEVFQEIEVKDEAGNTQLQRVPAAKVVPGSEVIYVITYRNVGAQAAENIVVSSPVPAELAYQGQAAFAHNGAIEVSVDGGQRFGALENLQVSAANGERRAAQTGDVTHVRWKVTAALGPAEQGSVSYRAVLR